MKIIEVIAAQGNADTVMAAAEKFEVLDCRLGVTDADGMQVMRLVVADSKLQGIQDMLQQIITGQPDARIIVIPVDTLLPRPDKQDREKEDSASASRELLYDSIEKNTLLDSNYLLLVLLSTIVAAIGLIEDNVAVIIGAMVIAPLLGPNLALALGSALGDAELMRKALVTSAAGMGLAIGLSIVLGYFWPGSLSSDELLSRTDASLDSIALALASGAAAALSMTTGLPSVLVGVMVAVALLPPSATFGIMLGQGEMQLAMGAALLLAVNVVCVNLASRIVFLAKGIEPRTWMEKNKAQRSMTLYILVWVISLIILVAAIYMREI